MIRDLVLASLTNVYYYLFMILILVKRYSIDEKEMHFVKGEGCALIGNPDHPDGTSTDRE